ncbi:MAG: hypothetical protein HY738_10065 [Bacteroidia bacterium]|nr:hypothetical protein [Bacteroidia bacterium]
MLTAANIISKEFPATISLINLQKTGTSAVGIRPIDTTQSSDYKDLLYGFYLDEGKIQVIRDGNRLNIIGWYEQGDNLKMIIDNSGINYYLNDKKIYNIATIANLEYQTDFLLYSKNATLKPIIFSLNPVIMSTINNATCEEPNSGSILVTFLYSSKIIVNYTWSGEGVVQGSANQYDLSAGTYYLTITYSIGSISYKIKKTYQIGTTLEWYEHINLVVSSINKITKFSSDGYDALAYSKNYLIPGENGWVKYFYTQPVKIDYLAFGLADNINQSSYYKEVINYGFSVYYKKFSNFSYYILKVLHEGSEYPYLMSGIKFTFKVEKSGIQMKYFRNGQQLPPPTGVDFTISEDRLLFAKANLYYYNSTIIKTNASFGCIPLSYCILQKKTDGGYYITNSCKLCFKYFEEYNDLDKSLSYKLYQLPDNDIPINQDMIISYGDNRFSMDISSLSEDILYILEVINQKDEKWYLRFMKNDCN